MSDEAIISPRGTYRQLRCFQLARLIYDLTVHFCRLYVFRYRRTREQMEQAARSGVQNIAEGNQVAGTSKKSEMKLTSVARGSIEELRLDYEDFLRQNNMALYLPDHPIMQRFKARRCSTLQDMQDWVRTERQLALDAQRAYSGPPETAPPVPSSAELAANGILSLINICAYLLDRLLAAQAEAFKREGGFTERLYRVRRQSRGKQW